MGYSMPTQESPTPTPRLPPISSFDNFALPLPNKYTVSSPAVNFGANYMSPPETMRSEFPHGHLGTSPLSGPRPTSRSTPILRTPPISPMVLDDHKLRQHDQQAATVRDPPLYSPSNYSPRSSQEPLFRNQAPGVNKMAIESLVHDHMASETWLFKTAAPNIVRPPSVEEYRMTAEMAYMMKPAIMSVYSNDPKGLLEDNKRQIQHDRRARLAHSTSSRKASRPNLLPAIQVQRSTETKSTTTPRSGAGRTSLPSQRSLASAQRPLNSRTNPKNDRVSKKGGSPHPERRQAAVQREDKNFGAIVDYCPPLLSIPSRPNCLTERTEWKGSPIDLSEDPNRHLLHKEELQLASCLRLDCATYLTSKRRIFLRRVECYEISKAFRKTDAQQACNIDINKASRLHTAYESIGWLDEKWIMKFVEERKQQVPVPSSFTQIQT